MIKDKKSEIGEQKPSELQQDENQKQEITDAEIAEINKFTRRKFSKDEIYIFSVVLCDNDIDRDFERFAQSSLDSLKKLFIGKTIIFDHERKSANQTARIFSTEIITDNTKSVANGENYTVLKAKAYLPKTEKNKETISAIESGILKEVSISCAVKSSQCSICGKENCNHKKGRKYGGELCHRLLVSPTDAYECSFVAVPAQRAAGVTKNYHGKRIEHKERELEDIVKSLESSEAQSLTKAESNLLKEHISLLEKSASWGDKYRESMLESILKYSSLTQPDMPREVLKSAISELDMGELIDMNEAYSKSAKKLFPLELQLKKLEEKQKLGEVENLVYNI